MKYKIKAYSIWEQGPRAKQEDSIYPEFGKAKDSDRLFILCDGMGGHSAGEVASGVVCKAMSEFILGKCSDPEGEFTDCIFQEALAAAFDALDAEDDGAEKKMGTTLTFLKLHDKGCTIAHIGDSRVYHIRPGQSVEDTEILFHTEDHSLVNDLIRIGELTPEEAKHSNQKNVITRAMQPSMSHRPKADVYHTSDIRPGDYFLLCSDGILEQMEDENLKYIFSEKGGDSRNKTDIIMKATSQNHDNHSAHLVHILEVVDQPGILADEQPVLPEPPMVEVEDSDVHVTDEIPMDYGDEEAADGHARKLWLVVLLVSLLAGGFYVYNNFIKDAEVKETQETKAKPEKAVGAPKKKPVKDAASKAPSRKETEEKAEPSLLPVDMSVLQDNAEPADPVVEEVAPEPVKKPVIRLPKDESILESDESKSDQLINNQE